MGFIQVFFAILLVAAGLTCAETPFGMVYGKVVRQYTIQDAEFDSLDLAADFKLVTQIYKGKEIILNQPNLPENVRYMLSPPPVKSGFDLETLAPPSYTLVTKIQVLQIMDSTGHWVKPASDSLLKLYSQEDTTLLTYNIKENRFYKFGTVARIDSLPRVIRPHHFSRPVTEEELPTFPYGELSEYTRFQQYIQLDTLDALPLYSTALRLVQEENYDSIPELLKISRSIKETYGHSPIERYEEQLALLGNDEDYLMSLGATGFKYSPNLFISDGSELGNKIKEDILDSKNDWRFENAIKVFNQQHQAQLRAQRTYAQNPSQRKTEKKDSSFGTFYIYFGGEAQLLTNGAQKTFKSDFQAGLNWMGVGGCGRYICVDYEVTFFYSEKTGEDHVVNDTLYNRENCDVRLSLLLEWRPILTQRFDLRAYVGYHWNAYSFKIDSDYKVDKNHQYNNIGDFGDFSLGGMLNVKAFTMNPDAEEWILHTGFRLKAGYIFLDTPEFNHLKGGGLTLGAFMFVGI